MSITAAQIKKIAPQGNAKIIENTAAAFNKYAEEYGFTTNLRKAHFLAQIAHESAGFKTTVEYGGSKTRYAPWYGRGLIQTTWQENYTDFYQWCVNKGLNPPEFYEAKDRDQVAEFPWAFLCAVWYWESRKLNALADKDNIKAITKKINGGYNGLADRIEYLERAKHVLGMDKPPVAVNEGAPAKTTYKVEEVQRALNTKGFTLVVDGKKGPATIAALRMFQKMNGLVADGLMGPITAKVLFG